MIQHFACLTYFFFNEVNKVKAEKTVYICLSRLLNYFKDI